MAEDERRDQTARRSTEAKAFTQPSVRTFTSWTPALIRSAETAADTGRLAMPAELCDRIMSDDRVHQALETRTGGLMGLPLTFESARGGVDGDAAHSDELEEDWFDSYPEDVLKQIQAWGIMLGAGFGEQVWVVDRGRFVPRLRFWHPQHFRWDAHKQRWFVKTGATGTQEVEIEPGDPHWLIYTPYGKHRPWASGLWRGLSRWWLLKNYAIGDWARHSENSTRTVVFDNDDAPAVPDEGFGAFGGKSQREQLANDVYAAGRDAVIVLPAGFDLKLIEASANTRDIYGAQIEAANEAFVITINGQNLTTSVKGGSLAAANVHERVEARRIRSDGETLSTTLRSQSVAYWAEWNFGDAEQAPWPTWATDPPEDLEAKAKIFVDVADASERFKKLGLRVKPETLSQEFGLPEFEEVEPPAAEPGPNDPPQPPPSGDKGSDRGPKRGKAGADTEGDKAAPQARLASGITARSDGFINGQVYADALADDGRDEMADHLREGIGAKLEAALDAAESFDELRELVLLAYEGQRAPHAVMADMTKRYVMAYRAGEVAVDQDAI